MEDFCGMLAAKDMEYLPELTEEELEHVLKCRHPPLPSYQLLRAGLSAVLSSKDY